MQKKILLIMVGLIAVLSGTCFFNVQMAQASPKSLYLVANHHTAQFDAWNIAADGTVNYQGTYNLAYATDPSGIAMDESSLTLFITSEFSGGVEMVDASTLTSLGVSTGPIDLAGIAVDDANNIVYAVRRWTNELYVYDWDPVARTLTPRSGFNPYHLPGTTGAFGIALDDYTGILWVADADSGVARAYDTTTWTEDTTLSFTPSHKPVAIAIDRTRKVVYTTSLWAGAWYAAVPSGCGSNFISAFDLTSRTETLIDMGHGGVGIAVDEVTGYVYVTGGYTNVAGSWIPVQNLEVWDPATSTELQDTGDIGNPAGICIPREEVHFYELGIEKTDMPDPVLPGATITYTITYDNLQNSFDVHNVVIIDYLPSETVFVSASDGGVYDPASHTVTWNIGTLPAGSGPFSVTLEVTVDPSTPPGSITNFAEIDSDETDLVTVYESTTVAIGQVIPVAPFGTILILTAMTVMTIGYFVFKQKYS